MFQSRLLRIAIGITVSLAFLAGAFYKIQPPQFWAALKSINAVNVLLCVMFFGLSCVFRALMWRLTTRPLGQVGFFTLFGGVVVGYMANNVLPLRAGELVRAFYLAARSDISKTAAFSTICIERVLDVVSLALLLALGVACGIQGLAVHTAEVALTALAAAVLAAVLLVAGLSWASGRKQGASNFFARLFDVIGKFVQPVRQLQKPKIVLALLGLSLAAWASNYFSVLALINGAVVSQLQAALLLLLFVNLGLLIPSSPGALGVMQVAFWTALAAFGVPKEQSLAYSFVYQGGLYLFTFAVGLSFLFRAHLRLKDVSGQLPTPEVPPEATEVAQMSRPN
ncbi:MAG: lysylphosphatidylglycerol synthase transmembrane domain-containing protein [Bacillota bacterium]